MNFERDFAPTMKRLAALFPQRPISDETVAAYWERLHDMDAGLFHAAVSQCIDRCEWFPTIAHIRRAAEDIVMDSIADPFEAMQRFPHRVKNPGLRAIVMSSLEHSDDRPADLRAQDGRPLSIPAHARRDGDGKPPA